MRPGQGQGLVPTASVHHTSELPSVPLLVCPRTDVLRWPGQGPDPCLSYGHQPPFRAVKRHCVEVAVSDTAPFLLFSTRK